MKKTAITALHIFHSLVRDRRYALACNARYADHSRVSIEFCGKHFATFDLMHDGSNTVECVLHAFAQSPIKAHKAFSLRMNTLGKRAVYSVATVDASDFEMYGVKHVRTTADVAQALLDAERNGLLEIDDGLSYCDAQMSAGKYSRRVWMRPTAADE